MRGTIQVDTPERTPETIMSEAAESTWEWRDPRAMGSAEERRAYMRSLRARPRRAHPWAAIEKAYVEGVLDEASREVTWPTLEQLARQYRIDPKQVWNQSRTKGWVAKRQALQRAVEDAAAAAKIRKLAQARVHDDFEVHDVANRGIELVKRRLKAIRADDDEASIARNAYFALKAADAPLEDLEATGYDPYAQAVDPRELTALGQALLAFQQASIRATGGIEATTRHEVTGAGGGALEVHSVHTELGADSVSRVEGLIEVIRRVQGELPPAPGEIVEGEIVQEGEG